MGSGSPEGDPPRRARRAGELLAQDVLAVLGGVGGLDCGVEAGHHGGRRLFGVDRLCAHVLCPCLAHRHSPFAPVCPEVSCLSVRSGLTLIRPDGFHLALGVNTCQDVWHGEF